MSETAKPRAIGLNHIALEVGDINEALDFYGRIFQFELRGRSETMAFVDLGDQFIALQKGRKQAADDGRHFGLVVDNKEAERRALKEANVTTLDGDFSIFATRGAIASRSWATTISNFPKRKVFCAAWGFRT
jgi:lactoylglutathione lyase